MDWSKYMPTIIFFFFFAHNKKKKNLQPTPDNPGFIIGIQKLSNVQWEKSKY